MKEVLFTGSTYNVYLLEEKKPIEQNGVTLYFHYGILNTLTDRTEGYSQFLPAAIEQAQVLDEHLLEVTPIVEAGGDNVVNLNS